MSNRPPVQYAYVLSMRACAGATLDIIGFPLGFLLWHYWVISMGYI